MPDVALEIWDRLAPQALAMGTLKPADTLLFGQLCVMASHLRKSWELGEAAPAAYIAQIRVLAEGFGLAGEKSRVMAFAPKQSASNPFSRNGRRPEGAA